MCRWLLEGGVDIGPARWHKDPSLSALLLRYYRKAVGSTLACCAFDDDPDKLGGWMDLWLGSMELGDVGAGGRRGDAGAQI